MLKLIFSCKLRNYEAKIQHNTDLTVSFLAVSDEKLEHDGKTYHRGGSLLVGIGPEPVLPYPGLQQEHAPWRAASALHRPIYDDDVVTFS